MNNQNQSRRILIFGGFGYLGFNIYSFLKEKNYKVSIGIRANQIPKNNFEDINFIIIKSEEIAKLAELFKGFEIVIIASGANSEVCSKNIINAINTNIALKAKIAHAAIKAEVKRIINLSTAHVYGKLSGFINEDCQTTNSHPYGFTNLGGEQSLKHICFKTGTKIINLRLSNVFGSPKSINENCWKLFVNNICMQGLLKKEMIIKNNHLQERDFLGIKEFCEIIEKILICEDDKINFDIYNVGSGFSTTLEDMAKIIKQQIFIAEGFAPKIIFKSTPKKQEKLNYSIKRLHNLIQYKQYKIEHHISELIKTINN